MIWFIELVCILFLALSGLFCVTWPLLRHQLPWEGGKWIVWPMYVLAFLVGVVHLLFAALKAWHTAGALLFNWSM